MYFFIVQALINITEGLLGLLPNDYRNILGWSSHRRKGGTQYAIFREKMTKFNSWNFFINQQKSKSKESANL